MPPRMLAALKKVKEALASGAPIESDTLDQIPQEIADRIRASRIRVPLGQAAGPAVLPRSAVVRTAGDDPYGIPSVPERMD